jgi:ATP-dependent Clp protease ATP-binding subunit ClpC
MFERYTEKARRTIFFARYEASRFGSPYIEAEHLLLGLLREDKSDTPRRAGGLMGWAASKAVGPWV